MGENRPNPSYDREIAFSSLFILTAWNMLLGAVMIMGVIPVEYGMILAFGGMLCIVIAAWKVLMGNELPWKSPRDYDERKENE